MTAPANSSPTASAPANANTAITSTPRCLAHRLFATHQVAAARPTAAVVAHSARAAATSPNSRTSPPAANMDTVAPSSAPSP
jgi:hypothetical protein